MTDQKKDPVTENQPPKDQPGNSENSNPPNPGLIDFNDSALYFYNRETGKWEVRNPAGSFGYNYLYRDE